MRDFDDIILELALLMYELRNINKTLVFFDKQKYNSIMLYGDFDIKIRQRVDELEKELRENYKTDDVPRVTKVSAWLGYTDKIRFEAIYYNSTIHGFKVDINVIGTKL